MTRVAYSCPVSQLPITAAYPSPTASRPDQANASAHGSQMLHGRLTPPVSDASFPLMGLVSSTDGRADNGGRVILSADLVG